MKKLKHFEVKLEERVLDDFEDALLHYELISPALGSNFTKMFYLAIEKLSLTPHNYYNLSRKLRRITLGKFPYLLIYKVENNVVVVIGLFHQRSKPSKWRQKK
jgi:toxin ParE1/3/4